MKEIDSTAVFLRSFGMRLLVFTGVGAFCLTAGAAPIYTVELPNGATNTLAEAFANGYVTSSEGAATQEGLKAAEALYVTGGGRLEINEDLKSAGFAGEVHVLSGAILRLTANGALGDTDHGTFVEDGATLETECLDTSAQSKLDFAGEKLSFAGTGVDGVGALVARTPRTYERNGVWGGTILTMTGDATITQVGQYQDFPNNSANNSLDMNGHTLTLYDTDNSGEFCFRAVIKNPGHIVITNAQVSMNDFANLAGDASNTLTVMDSGRLDLYSNTTVGQKKWTLRVPATCMKSMVVQTSSNGGIWDGPIVAERSLVVGMLGQGSDFFNTSKLRGPITAKDAFAICRRDANPPQIPDVELHSPQNSFARGLALTNVNLKVMANGALPASMGTGVLTANNVAFTFDDADREQTWSLPQMTVVGKVSIGDCAGTWAGIVKSAGATLTCSADAPSFSNLDLEAGTMSLAEPNANFNAGLYEGWHAYAYWHKDTPDGFTDEMMKVYKANQYCDTTDNNATNGVTLGVRLAYESQTFDDQVPNEYGTLVQAQGYAVNYQGYIWNPDPTNVTWSFAGSEQTVSTLWINGQTVYQRQATATSPENGTNADLRHGNATLRPGANTFWWRIGVSGRTVGPNGSVKSCSTWTDKTKMGLVYDRMGRNSTNPDDYERLINSASGNLFTLTVPSTPAYAALKERTTVRRMERLSGTVGAILEAPSRQLIVRMLKGCPKVKTASSWLAEAGLFVKESFVARAADLAAEHGLVTDGKLDFAEGCTFALEGEFDALKGGTSVVATAAKGIQGLPVVTGDAAEQFRLVKSEDGKTLSLEYIPNGTLIIFR